MKALIVCAAVFLAACSPTRQGATGSEPRVEAPRAIDYDSAMPTPGGRRGAM